jgi:hypothetical protein
MLSKQKGFLPPAPFPPRDPKASTLLAPQLGPSGLVDRDTERELLFLRPTGAQRSTHDSTTGFWREATEDTGELDQRSTSEERTVYADRLRSRLDPLLGRPLAPENGLAEPHGQALSRPPAGLSPFMNSDENKPRSLSC